MRPTALDDTRRRFMAHFAGIGLGASLAPGVLGEDAGSGAQRVTLEMVTDTEAGEDRRHRSRAAGDGQRRQPEPRECEAIRRLEIPNDVSPLSFQRDRAWHRHRQDEEGVSAQRSADHATARESRRGRVLARAAPRRVDQDEEGHVQRTDRDVSRPASPLQRHAEQRRHVPRRHRARAGEAGGCRGRGEIPWSAARHSLGREGHHLGEGLQDDLGDRVAQGSSARLRRERRGDAARCRRGADRQADDRRTGGRRQLVRRADEVSWDPAVGSSGSSAGPSSATAAGCVGFAIGTETSGSILSPAARCGRRVCVRRSAASAVTA